MTDPATIDDIGNLVRILALTTLDETRPSSRLVQPALLQQLRTNIVPDGDGAGGVRKAAGSRFPINAAAMDLYQWLEGKIARLHEGATGSAVLGSPEELLVQWYIAIRVEDAAGPFPQAYIDIQVEQLEDWRTRIMDHFRPPEAGEIQKACPECGWTYMTFTTADGQTRQYALVKLVRPWRKELSVKCRQCNTVWAGKGAIEELCADLGLVPGELRADEPAPEPIKDESPLWLCAMTADQAKAYAQEHHIPQRDVLLASGGGQRVRYSTRPILFATIDDYQPGKHEKAKVDELIRVAKLVNRNNGFTEDGREKDVTNA